MLDRTWNAERFIVFQTVTLQRARDIRQRIEKRLDAWEAGAHKMLVEDTLRSSTQYLTAVRSFPRSTEPRHFMAWWHNR